MPRHKDEEGEKETKREEKVSGSSHFNESFNFNIPVPVTWMQHWHLKAHVKGPDASSLH